MIAWKYLNKPSATVAALQDYSTMREIINITPQETKALYDRMTSVGGRPLTSIPTSWNPQAGEERLIKSLDTLDVIQERYRQAVEYMAWFLPAWEELSGDERYVLETFYSDEERQTDSIYDICDRFHIERTSAYKKKNRALQKLVTLLYGKS